ncbi:MAG: Phosphatidylglycerophosphate synthase [Frankiales bacterium]|nr:Phosphatidylglycerophosphate synthase [Frankiales bacterium]
MTELVVPPAADAGLRVTLRLLAQAQKGSVGAPAYSRFVNRPMGRLFAALAFPAGVSPNAVTATSAACTFTGAALVALAGPSIPLGLAIAACLVLGYGLDAADGQLARLRGGGSPAGEWLDHMVDAAKLPVLHLSVLVGLYRSGSVHSGWLLLVPVVYCAVDSVTFFGMMLNETLRVQNGVATRAARTGERVGALRALLTLPTDYGTLAWTFVLFGVPSLFVPLYTAMAVAACAFLVLAGVKWFREMGRLGA